MDRLGKVTNTTITVHGYYDWTEGYIINYKTENGEQTSTLAREYNFVNYINKLALNNKIIIKTPDLLSRIPFNYNNAANIFHNDNFVLFINNLEYHTCFGFVVSVIERFLDSNNTFNEQLLNELIKYSAKNRVHSDTILECISRYNVTCTKNNILNSIKHRVEIPDIHRYGYDLNSEEFKQEFKKHNFYPDSYNLDK